MASKVKRIRRPRQSNKQKVWGFMRRNRQFRAGDIMMILDVNSDFLLPIFRVLELAGYLELESGSQTFKDRHYKLVKDTGILSPFILKKPCDIVRDENNGDEFVLDGSHPIQIKDKIKLLRAMRTQEITREVIANNAGMNQYSAKVFRYLEEFIEAGIMERSGRLKNNRSFNINLEKRANMLEELGGVA